MKTVVIGFGFHLLTLHFVQGIHIVQGIQGIKA